MTEPTVDDSVSSDDYNEESGGITPEALSPEDLVRHALDSIDDIAALNLGKNDTHMGAAWEEDGVLNVRVHPLTHGFHPDWDIWARKSGTEGQRRATLEEDDDKNNRATFIELNEGFAPRGRVDSAEGRHWLTEPELAAETDRLLLKLRETLQEGIQRAGSSPAQEDKTIEPPEALEADARTLERFMQATDRVFEVFSKWSKQHSELSLAAQAFEFVASQPQLANTRSVTVARERLKQAIERSEAPADIVDVYRELYPELFDQEPQADL